LLYSLPTVFLKTGETGKGRKEAREKKRKKERKEEGRKSGVT